MGSGDLAALAARAACGDFGTDGARVELDVPRRAACRSAATRCASCRC